MWKKKFSSKKNKGFTLVETIVVIFIFTLALGALLGSILILYRTHGYTKELSEAIEEAKKGVRIMVEEIRKAESAENGNYPIEEAQDFEFIFYSNVDRDKEVERVRYFLENGKLKKGVIDPQGWPPEYPTSTEKITIISNYVVNQPPIFRYYDSKGQELPPPARKKDTKLMEVYLVIDVNPVKTPQAFELKSKVLLRNLKREWY